jgi:hypothetical protein
MQLSYICELVQGIHGVKTNHPLRGCAQTSVLVAVFPLTTLFVPLLDRLTLASSGQLAPFYQHLYPEDHAVSHGSVSVYSSY